MKLFTCASCRNLLFFENVQCGRCGSPLAYVPEHKVLSTLEPATGDAGVFRALAPEAEGGRYRLCDNYTRYATCNWAVPAKSGDTLCLSCRLSKLIPDLSVPGAVDAWRRLETAKRRLLYTLLQLGLPVEEGLAFEFKNDTAEEKVFTGHNEGVITNNAAEADAPFREQMREQMGEAYRTLLGHFRHEIGHYYWSRLIEGGRRLEPWRSLFGDEREDYDAAVQRHYAEGPPADWTSSYVSAYASAHPLEVWAESFAHYLHMVDTLETARSHGLTLQPRPLGGAPTVEVKARRLHFDDFDDLVTAWFPLTLSLNSFNRGMGLPDLYPFVLSDGAITKLRFVHDVIEAETSA